MVRTILLAGLVLAGQAFTAASEPDCRYGEDEYTRGAILCQAGQRMQCKSDAKGQATWVSLEQQCTDPAIATSASPKPDGAHQGEMRGHVSGDETSLKTVTGETFFIEILWADYGRDGRRCDAGPAVSERCGGKTACDIEVRPNALCGDPFPGKPKLLSVYWRCTDGSAPHSQPASYGQDDSNITLQCTS
jgi:hypothetical protein